jgi:hypothetical protein
MKYKRTNIRLLIAILVCAFALGVASGVRAQQPNRVGLVVVHGDGSTITRCIEFSGAEISGYDVLQRSGLEIVASHDPGMGAALCAIDGEGCGAEDCFCQCQGSTCIYWSYWHLDGGDWVYSAVGASAYKAHNGDVEGLRWGEGDPPPVIPFDQICAPPPTDTPIPVTDTPVPPTDTLPPSTPTVWFRLDANPIAAGSCTFVQWDTANAAEVYLDGERVDPNGSREVCPTASQEYYLRVVSAAGEKTYTLILGVTGTPSATAPTPATSIPPSPVPTAAPATVASAGAIPSPSPTPSPAPTATPQPMTVGAAPPEPAATSLPIAAASQPATRQPVSDAQTRPSSPGFSYVIFGGIAAGLVGLLVFLMRRRR